jgi:hypothetical protein
MTAESNPNFLPFEQEFILRMTFDPALADGQTYGPVRFSPVPLPSVAPPAGLPLTTNAFTAHGQFPENEDDPLNLFATATVYEFNITAQNGITSERPDSSRTSRPQTLLRRSPRPRFRRTWCSARRSISTMEQRCST